MSSEFSEIVCALGSDAGRAGRLLHRERELGRHQMQAALTAFVVLSCVVGLTLWGLPFYCDYMTQQFGWTRAQVTSGNALSKLAVGRSSVSSLVQRENSGAG